MTCTRGRERHAGGSDGRRSRDLTIFSRALYQLSYRALTRTPDPAKPEPGDLVLLTAIETAACATLTGLEPATSAVTGRHANQLRYRALHLDAQDFLRSGREKH